MSDRLEKCKKELKACKDMQELACWADEYADWLIDTVEKAEKIKEYYEAVQALKNFVAGEEDDG